MSYGAQGVDHEVAKSVRTKCKRRPPALRRSWQLLISGIWALLPALCVRTPSTLSRGGLRLGRLRSKGEGADLARAAPTSDGLVLRVPSDIPSVERAIAAAGDRAVLVEQGWHRWEGQLVVSGRDVRLSSQLHSSLTGRWVLARGSCGFIQHTAMLYSCPAGAAQTGILVLGGSGKGVGPWKFEHCRMYSHGAGSVALVCSGASRVLLSSCILGGHSPQVDGTQSKTRLSTRVTRAIRACVCVCVRARAHLLLNPRAYPYAPRKRPPLASSAEIQVGCPWSRRGIHFVCVSVCVCVYESEHAHMHACVRACAQAHASTRRCVCPVSAPVFLVPVPTHTLTLTLTHTHTHTHTHLTCSYATHTTGSLTVPALACGSLAPANVEVMPCPSAAIRCISALVGQLLCIFLRAFSVYYLQWLDDPPLIPPPFPLCLSLSVCPSVCLQAGVLLYMACMVTNPVCSGQWTFAHVG